MRHDQRMVEHGLFRGRGTADVVIIILSLFVGGILLLALIVLFLTELTQPEVDTSQAVAVLGNVITGAINVILGAVAGFIAGRGSRRRPELE